MIGPARNAAVIEAEALVAADVAFTSYRESVPEAAREWARPEWVIPATSGPPTDPLLSALADLGSAAFCAAQVLHTARALDPLGPDEATLAVAAAATRAAELALVAHDGASDADAATLCAEVARAAALAAHLSADLLEASGSAGPGFDGARRPPSFPGSRRTLLQSLSAEIGRARQRHAAAGPARQQLVDVAAAARDGAAHVVAAYDHCRHAVPACRLARITMRAACDTGFAALALAGAMEPLVES